MKGARAFTWGSLLGFSGFLVLKTGSLPELSDFVLYFFSGNIVHPEHENTQVSGGRHDSSQMSSYGSNMSISGGSSL